MTTKDFSAEQRKALHKIELLLNKAAGNANEHEASVATQLAQDLLAKYNLDMESVGSGASAGAERQDTKILGGFSEFERELWKAIAELNWCWYFSTITTDTIKGRKQSRAHRLVGKKVNILSTKMMADYLLTAINRLAKEYCLAQTGTYHNRSAMATSFRKGAAERLVGRLQDKRSDILRDEQRQEEERTRSGVGAGGTALVMTRLSQSEYERNYDFLYGEGAYAKALAQQEERRRIWLAQEEERAARDKAWREANPEEAAKLDREAERAAKREEARWRKRAERDQNRRERPVASDPWAYYAGSSKAGNIGLDDQIDSGKGPAGHIGAGE
ncbi:MAG: DUF2786 domain-containing protein [Bacilli bacterium]